MSKNIQNDDGIENEAFEPKDLPVIQGLSEPTGEMIASVQADGSDIILHREQGERHAVKTETHTAVTQQIQKWIAVHKAKKVTAETHDTQEHTQPPETTNALVPLRQQTGALIGMRLNTLSPTPLEDKRREMGLDRERREIYDELGMTSWERCWI